MHWRRQARSPEMKKKKRRTRKKRKKKWKGKIRERVAKTSSARACVPVKKKTRKRKKKKKIQRKEEQCEDASRTLCSCNILRPVSIPARAPCCPPRQRGARGQHRVSSTHPHSPRAAASWSTSHSDGDPLKGGCCPGLLVFWYGEPLRQPRQMGLWAGCLERSSDSE